MNGSARWLRGGQFVGWSDLATRYSSCLFSKLPNLYFQRSGARNLHCVILDLTLIDPITIIPSISQKRFLAPLGMTVYCYEAVITQYAILYPFTPLYVTPSMM